MSKKQITVRINGETKLIEQSQTIEFLLKQLNLSKNKISDKGLLHLEKLKKLETLNLFNTEVSNELLTVIPKLALLKRLYISESYATNEIVYQLQKENKKLKIIFD